MLKFNFCGLFCSLILTPMFSFSQVSLPFNEKFGNSPTVSQWNFPNTIAGNIPDVGSPNGDLGCIFYNFYNTQGYPFSAAESPLLEASSGNSPIKVTFDFAGANRYTMPIALQTNFADDHIILEYSMNKGVTYNVAHDYEIGVTGELNTGGILPYFFTPTASQWVTKSFVVPPGTNKIRFKGVKNDIYQAGNFCYLDNVIFEECNTSAPTGSTSQQFCGGNTLAQLSVAGANIQWYDAPTGGNLLPNTTPLVSGITYYASQTQDLCESLSRLAITVSSGACLSVNDVGIPKSAIDLYPNPVGETLFLKSKQSIRKVTIYDMVGGRVMEVSHQNITSVNVGQLVKGIYMVKIDFADGVITTEKMIKK